MLGRSTATKGATASGAWRSASSRICDFDSPTKPPAGNEGLATVGSSTPRWRIISQAAYSATGG